VRIPLGAQYPRSHRLPTAEKRKASGRRVVQAFSNAVISALLGESSFEACDNGGVINWVVDGYEDYFI